MKISMNEPNEPNSVTLEDPSEYFDIVIGTYGWRFSCDKDGNLCTMWQYNKISLDDILKEYLKDHPMQFGDEGYKH